MYREFIGACGFPLPAKPQPSRLVDLLEQIVGIHGISSHSLNRSRQFVPVEQAQFECDKDRKEAWISFYVSKGDLAISSSAATDLRKHMKVFQEVESLRPGCRRYESAPRKYGKTPIHVLRDLVTTTWQDMWSELRPGGYRFWVNTIPHKKRMAQLAAGYQAMFYFGSVARYQPDDLRKLLEGKHGWLVREFIGTQPLQFVYFLGSGILQAEMVVPEL